MALALHRGSELRSLFPPQGMVQFGQEGRDRERQSDCSSRGAIKFRGSLIGQFNKPALVDCDDGRRTGFNQRL